MSSSVPGWCVLQLGLECQVQTWHFDPFCSLCLTSADSFLLQRLKITFHCCRCQITPQGPGGFLERQEVPGCGRRTAEPCD